MLPYSRRFSKNSRRLVCFCTGAYKSSIVRRAGVACCWSCCWNERCKFEIINTRDYSNQARTIPVLALRRCVRAAAASPGRASPGTAPAGPSVATLARFQGEQRFRKIVTTSAISVSSNRTMASAVPVVIDNGAGLVKVGRASDASPVFVACVLSEPVDLSQGDGERDHAATREQALVHRRPDCSNRPCVCDVHTAVH